MHQRQCVPDFNSKIRQVCNTTVTWASHCSGATCRWATALRAGKSIVWHYVRAISYVCRRITYIFAHKRQPSIFPLLTCYIHPKLSSCVKVMTLTIRSRPQIGSRSTKLEMIPPGPCHLVCLCHSSFESSPRQSRHYVPPDRPDISVEPSSTTILGISYSADRIGDWWLIFDRWSLLLPEPLQ